MMYLHTAPPPKAKTFKCIFSPVMNNSAESLFMSNKVVEHLEISPLNELLYILRCVCMNVHINSDLIFSTGLASAGD